MAVRDGGPLTRLPSIILHVQILFTISIWRLCALDGHFSAFRADLLGSTIALS